MWISIEYTYKVFGVDGSYISNISNSSTVYEVESEPGSEVNNLQIQIAHSSAVANIKGIKITKVDAKNNAIKLQGAEFDLYEYDGSDYKFYKKYKTDKNGEIIIENIKYNTAYKLEETKAPDEYLLNEKPTYFKVHNEDKKLYPERLPNNFNGEIIIDGGQLVVDNVKPTTNTTVQKKWVDANGVQIDAPLDSIEVKLYRCAIHLIYIRP